MFIALLLWLLPIGRQVSAPALARASHDIAVFLRCRRKSSRSRSPTVSRCGGATSCCTSARPIWRAEPSEHLRAEGYSAEAARVSASSAQLERRLITEQQLGEALADEAGATGWTH